MHTLPAGRLQAKTFSAAGACAPTAVVHGGVLAYIQKLMWLSIKLLWLHWYGNVCKRKGSSRVAAVSRDLQCIMTAGRCRRPSQHNAIYTAAATARESQPHMEGVIWLVNGVTIAHYQSVIFRSAWITAPTGLLNIGCRANLSCAAVLSGGMQSNPWLSPVFFS